MRGILTIAGILAVLLSGCANLHGQDEEAHAALKLPPSLLYVIDTKPNISLHRAYNFEGNTYLEFLDAHRMNPVITGPDAVPLEFSWTKNHVILEGIHANLTITTPHGVAHVYSRPQAPPSRVAGPTPPRAPEYGVTVPVARPILSTY